MANKIATDSDRIAAIRAKRDALNAELKDFGPEPIAWRAVKSGKGNVYFTTSGGTGRPCYVRQDAVASMPTAEQFAKLAEHLPSK